MRKSLELKFEGRTYKVSYSVDRGIITVNFGFDSKSTQLGSSSPEGLASIIGKELLREAKLNGTLT